MKINHNSEITYKPEGFEIRWGKTTLKLQFIQKFLNDIKISFLWSQNVCFPVPYTTSFQFH